MRSNEYLQHMFLCRNNFIYRDNPFALCVLSKNVEKNNFQDGLQPLDIYLFEYFQNSKNSQKVLETDVPVEMDTARTKINLC